MRDSTYRRCLAIALGSGFASLVLAQSAPPPADAVLTGPLARKITSEDRRGIDALFDAAADAWRKKDMQALTALYAFPIYVGTDNSAGAYQGSEWDADQFRENLTPAVQADSKGLSRKERRTPHFLSDAMAMVLVETSVSRGGTELGSVHVGHSGDQERRAMAVQEWRRSRPRHVA